MSIVERSIYCLMTLLLSAGKCKLSKLLQLFSWKNSFDIILSSIGPNARHSKSRNKTEKVRKWNKGDTGDRAPKSVIPYYHEGLVHINVNVRSEQSHEFRLLQTGQLEKLGTSQFIDLTTDSGSSSGVCVTIVVSLAWALTHEAQIEAQCLLSFAENGLGVYFSTTPKMILTQVLS